MPFTGCLLLDRFNKGQCKTSLRELGSHKPHRSETRCNLQAQPLVHSAEHGHSEAANSKCSPTRETQQEDSSEVQDLYGAVSHILFHVLMLQGC